ncbi:MAG: NmrA/HSCARG family protein [Vicinamibacterales bacterium]
MTDTKTILITGATGNQGGATARALAGKGFTIRAMTRKPTGEAAKAIAATGATIVEGDLDDLDSVRAALESAWGAYAVQNTWEAGVLKEEEQGHRFATAARDAGVQHFVYSSVGSAHRRSGIPHFENKSRVEDTVRSLGFASYTIIRPVFFMENLASPWFLNDNKLYAALAPTTAVQMIAVSDIGKYGAKAFLEPDRLNRRELDIAGDEVTMPEAAAALSRGLGRQIDFVQIPISEVRKNSEDFATMLEWFEAVGYDVHIKSIAREFGIEPLSIEQWARTLKT